MREYISKFIETENLIIKDASMDECDELQNICSTWEDKALMEGEGFEPDYILKCLTEGDLPPIEGASRERYSLKSVYSKHENRIIGLVEMYHGYPKPDTLWISIFVLRWDIQGKGIGQEVIGALTRDAVDTAYSKIGIGVYLKNWKALRFWTKVGFDKVIGIYGDKVFSQDTFALIGLEKKVSYSDSDGKKLVEGLLFNSPNLQKE